MALYRNMENDPTKTGVERRGKGGGKVEKMANDLKEQENIMDKLDKENPFLKGFLTKKEEREEIMKNYVDYGFADLVLVFPNPDGNKIREEKGNHISYKEALEIFG